MVFAVVSPVRLAFSLPVGQHLLSPHRFRSVFFFSRPERAEGLLSGTLPFVFGRLSQCRPPFFFGLEGKACSADWACTRSSSANCTELAARLSSDGAPRSHR